MFKSCPFSKFSQIPEAGKSACFSPSVALPEPDTHTGEKLWAWCGRSPDLLISNVHLEGRLLLRSYNWKITNEVKYLHAKHKEENAESCFRFQCMFISVLYLFQASAYYMDIIHVGYLNSGA